MKAAVLTLVLLLVPLSSDSASCVAVGKSCGTAVTFSATAVQPLTLTINEGVVLANGRIGFYDDRLRVVEVTEQDVVTLGSRILWAGEPAMVAQQ